jgi:pimeloyl-ACP methyl ester carboxylesterase
MATDATDLVIEGAGVSLAIRDFGGSGVGIVLIHGLSRTLEDWTVVAPILASRHHVVAMDVRGHGKSGDGPWSWAAAVEDVDAVASHCGMSRPAVMGHSLGGMIASMWGRDHSDSAGVVNLDGHGNPRADQYVGLDPAWVTEKRAELEALQKQQLAAMSGPLSEAQIEALTVQQKTVAARVGAPEDGFVAGLHRMLEVRQGDTCLRPAPDGYGGEIYAGLDEVDMFGIYREIRCPLLLFNAVDPPGASGPSAGPPGYPS